MASWRGTPTIGEDKVGITFVDVLFALVVGEILTPLRRWWTIPAVGWSHLAVALALTLGSWIGYHTSANRQQYPIKFFNLPFVSFLLDIAMVIAYWLTATSAELAEHVGTRDIPARGFSAVPEAALVTASFVLYAAWDQIARLMKSTAYYVGELPTPDDRGRRLATLVFLAVSEALFGAALAVQRWHYPRAWVLALDVALVVDLLLYRWSKELWRNRVSNRTAVAA